MQLLKKLNYKNQGTVHLIKSPHSFEQIKGDFKKMMQVSENLENNEPVLFVLVFFTKKSEVREVIEKLMEKINKDSLIWLCYPKKSSKNYNSDLSRDTGWEIMGEYAYEPVRQIAIDDDWSALRFRPISEIKDFTRDQKMVLSDEGKHKVNTRK